MKFNLQVEPDAFPGAGPIGRQIARLGPWFHNIHLPGGEQTAPNHPLGDFPSFKWKQIRRYFPADLSGKTALDIGCNAGFYAIQLARRGASVTAVDHSEHYLRQARWAARQFDVQGQVRFVRADVYDLVRPERGIGERFDIVLFMGVLYHLRYPLLGLEIAASLTAGVLVFQSATTPDKRVSKAPKDLPFEDRNWLIRRGWPRMSFVEHAFASDRTNWWFPNAACCEAMLRTCGMRVRGRPGHEIYVCQPASPTANLLSREARSALGLGPAVRRRGVAGRLESARRTVNGNGAATGNGALREGRAAGRVHQ